MEQQPYISIIIPAYNEGGRKGNEMKKNFEDIGQYMQKNNLSFEVIVVSDGSKDNTVEFAKTLSGLVDNKLSIIDRKENRGKWFSVREGFLAARGQYCLFTDADGATNISNLDGFLPHMQKGANVIIGSRDLSSSKIEKHQPKWKEILGDMGNLLIQVLTGLRGIPDTQCGFKAFSREVIDRIIPQLKVDRWGGDFELLALARKMKYEIIEVPVVWEDAGLSLVGVSGMGGYVSTLKELLQVKWRMVTGKYNIKKK